MSPRTVSTTYLLIGGGLGSSRAADQIRKIDPDGPVLLVTDEPCPPYDRPPLSKEFLRRQRDVDDLVFHSPTQLSEQRIDLLTDAAVVSLDPMRSTAALADGSQVRFERALIATGGRPRRLELPGEGLGGVHYLRSMNDAVALRDGAGTAGRIVIIGAGFIGVEAAASLAAPGRHVTLLETAARIWPRFADDTIADFVRRYCAERGIAFALGESAVAIRGTERATSVVAASGREWPCDLVLIAVGITPCVALAEGAGLAVDDGIVVDSRMRTSHPAVYGAGDVIAFPDPIFKRRRRVEHWGHAEHSGQVAGMNMADGDREYGLLSYVWSDVFDLHLEFAGDESDHDAVLVRGDLERAAFTVLYLRRHCLTAFCSINGSRKDFGPLQKLIRQQIDLKGRESQLTDPEQPVRALI